MAPFSIEPFWIETFGLTLWDQIENADGDGQTFNARRDSRRRPRHALLAAEPHAHAETTAEYRRQRNHAGADRRAAAALDSCRTHTWTVTNAEQAAAVRKQLPAPARRRVLTEPVGRNTAAAIALAALHVRHAARGDALLAVLPADHYIANPERYRVIMRAALDLARDKGRMVVLGIPPTRPETGFGYIERMGEALDSRGFPVYAVRRFTEKPALAVAKEYAGSGNYHWNAGMFFWRVSTFLDNLRKLSAENARSARIAGREHRQTQLRKALASHISGARKYFRRLRHPRTWHPRTGQPPRLCDSRRGRLERHRLLDRRLRTSSQALRRKHFCRRRSGDRRRGQFPVEPLQIRRGHRRSRPGRRGDARRLADLSPRSRPGRRQNREKARRCKRAKICYSQANPACLPPYRIAYTQS